MRRFFHYSQQTAISPSISSLNRFIPKKSVPSGVVSKFAAPEAKAQNEQKLKFQSNGRNSRGNEQRDGPKGNDSRMRERLQNGRRNSDGKPNQQRNAGGTDANSGMADNTGRRRPGGEDTIKSESTRNKRTARNSTGKSTANSTGDRSGTNILGPNNIGNDSKKISRDRRSRSAVPPPPVVIADTVKKRTVKKVEQKRPTIVLPRFISITNFATILKLRLPYLQKRMQRLGFENVNHDYIVDEETAVLIAEELGFDAVVNDQQGVDLFPAPPPKDLSSVPLRPPIVTIMGHVDHGKTTILDYLRKSSIVQGEFGGITQHIGAFSVRMASSNKTICFLDTPGHAAFLNMRQRGANVTDLVILVVAADDSVKPQTKEAIKHAKNAGVPLIVALNKMDKDGADPDRCLVDLAANDVDVEDYGGETQVVRISGKTGAGIDKLEEAILTLSEVLDIRASPTDRAEGWVIESQVKKGLGSVATVLIKRGTLKVGTAIVAGTKFCKVRSLRDDGGKVVKTAGPGTPVEVLGWKDLPEAGDMVLEAESEALARQVVENRLKRESVLKEAEDIAAINEKRIQMHLEAEKEEGRQERIKRGLPIEEDGEEADGAAGPEQVYYIIKADVSGSAEAVADSINGLGNHEVQARVLYSGVGSVAESDITRAEASKATILTFNLKTDKDVLMKAGRSAIEIVSHNVIYRLVEHVTKMLTDKLEPEIKHKVIAEAAIKEVFSITVKKNSKTLIAGCRVINGLLARKDKVRVLRNKQSIYEGTFSSMKHLKDEVSEVRKDTECGVAFKNWEKFEAGDIIQTYEEIIIPRHL